MRHDVRLTDHLAGLPTETFAGRAYRATRQSLDPLAFSSRGGRWAPTDEVAALYTSLDRDGALAEISYHWGQLDPLPSKPAMLHTLTVEVSRSLRLVRTDLELLGVELERFEERLYSKTQEIGAAVAFIGCDGLMVPSARWNCTNLILFNDNHIGALAVERSELVDWQRWARENGLLPDS